MGSVKNIKKRQNGLFEEEEGVKMAYKIKRKKQKYYLVINKEGEYSQNSGQYCVSKIKPPTMRKGSQVISTAWFNSQVQAEKFKKKGGKL